jgi:hypothetical protein
MILCPRLKLTLLVGALVLFFGGCGSSPQLQHELDRMIAANQYKQASALIEQNKDNYTPKNAVLYYADLGIVLHYGGMYRESIASLLEAEQRLEALYTRSISKQAATFVINDTLAPYRGEDFEGVMLNLFLALNYVQLGQIEDALVEARKVDAKLNLINSGYPPDKQNVYKEDAFVRLLMGIIYEIGGTRLDRNDALVSYKIAAQYYEENYRRNYATPAPKVLKTNLLTLAGELDASELNVFKERYPAVDASKMADRKLQGELYFIHYNGKSPEKIEGAIWAPMPDGYIMKIAFPEYRLRPYMIEGSTIRVTAADSGDLTLAQTELGENIAAIAMQSLKDRKLRIAAKAIARATAKYLAVKAAEDATRKEHGKEKADLVRLLGNISAIALEHADLRCWETLPAEIRIGKCTVPPGQYHLDLDLKSSAGTLVKQMALDDVTVRAGEKKIILFRTVE